MKLFKLKPGQEFIFNGRRLKIKRFVKKYMPMLGRVLNCECVDSHGAKCKFIQNWDVEIP